MGAQYIVDSFRCENALGDLGNQTLHCSLCKLCENYSKIVESIGAQYIENSFRYENSLGDLGNQTLHCSLCKLCQNYFDVVEKKMQPANILWFHNTLADR